MKYVSVDVETTGLDPERDQLLQLAMVVEDTSNIQPIEELPAFCAYVKHERVQGDAFALAMNARHLDFISGRVTPSPYPVLDFKQWLRGFVREAHFFLDKHIGADTKAVAAGKNFGSFDRNFLPPELRARFHHRCIDPGSVFIDWDKATPPSLDTLLGRPVEHDALADARAVIEVLRRGYAKGTL